jgi:hypothetical protein
MVMLFVISYSRLAHTEHRCGFNVLDLTAREHADLEFSITMVQTAFQRPYSCQIAQSLR